MTHKYAESSMRGEFRGDFTRDTFNPVHQFSKVLMQQGRVQIDADWNEQVSILTHYLRGLAADLIGPHGAPAGMDGNPGEGFRIEAKKKTIIIHPGPYYVNGIRCDGHTDAKEEPLEIEKKSSRYLIYLDVWERHVSYVEKDSIREVALTGADTATRAKIEWQVKQQPLDQSADEDMKAQYTAFLNALKEKRPGSGRMRARARKSDPQEMAPCLIAPESRYRGLENQLYRVEIHNSGDEKKATFKWSRENGSVIFPITDKVDGPLISLEHLGRDCRYGLNCNDWVEIYDDDHAIKEERGHLFQVEEVDHDNRQVRLSPTPGADVGADPDKHPYLRRWDHKNGNEKGVPLKEGSGENGWIDLEDGIQIQFLKTVSPAKKKKSPSRQYYAGDYWLIPARTISGDVEWPGPQNNPHDLPAHGTVHHYAPLALVHRKNENQAFKADDLRRVLTPLWK